MNDITREIIEKYIDLINTNQFDKLFNIIEQEYLYTTCCEVGKTLESAGIFPISQMSFIPEAYYMNSMLSEYTTPISISEIHYKAFDNSDIEKLHITGNCKIIAQDAFPSCGFLQSVIIDDGLEHISDAAFYDCDDLEYVVLPKSLKSIGRYIFGDCDKLTEITYKGSKKNWQNIQHHDYINDHGYIRYIKCVDGIIEL